MLNRAALFATMIAGAGLTGALLLGQSGAVAAEPVQVTSEPTPVLEHAAAGLLLLTEGCTSTGPYPRAN